MKEIKLKNSKVLLLGYTDKNADVKTTRFVTVIETNKDNKLNTKAKK